MTLKRTSLVAVTVVAVSAVAGLVGFNIDRPVWLSEHTVLAGEVKDNTVYRHEMSVLQIQQRIWDVEDRMKKVGRDSDLMNRLRELERSLKTAEGRLKKVRGH